MGHSLPPVYTVSNEFVPPISLLTNKDSKAASMALASSSGAGGSCVGFLGSSLDLPLKAATAAITRDPRIPIAGSELEDSSLTLRWSTLGLRLAVLFSKKGFWVVDTFSEAWCAWLDLYAWPLSRLDLRRLDTVSVKDAGVGPDVKHSDFGRGFHSRLRDNVGCSEP